MALPHVMVLGCGRSGTSIFGELFAAIPGYTYRSEPPFRDVVAADYAAPQAFKVPREERGAAVSPGLSFSMHDLLAAAPGMVFFWITRHPLDAISSLRVGIAKNWGHHPRPPDWRSWGDRSLVEKCAHHWAYLNTVGFASVKERSHVMRFERMIQSPEAFVRRVGDVLRVDRLHADPFVRRWIDRVQDTNNAQFVEAQTSRSYSRHDHSVRVGRWKENLSSADLAQAIPIVAKAARLHGYALPD